MDESTDDVKIGGDAFLVDHESNARILLIDVDRTIVTPPLAVAPRFTGEKTVYGPVNLVANLWYHIRLDILEFLTFFKSKGYRIALASHNTLNLVPNLAKFLRDALGWSDDELRWFVWPPGVNCYPLKDVQHLFTCVFDNADNVILPRFAIIDDQINGVWSAFSIKYSDSFNIEPFLLTTCNPDNEQLTMHTFRSAIKRSDNLQWRSTDELAFLQTIFSVLGEWSKTMTQIIVDYAIDFEFSRLCYEYAAIANTAIA